MSGLPHPYSLLLTRYTSKRAAHHPSSVFLLNGLPDSQQRQHCSKQPSLQWHWSAAGGCAGRQPCATLCMLQVSQYDRTRLWESDKHRTGAQGARPP